MGWVNRPAGTIANSSGPFPLDLKFIKLGLEELSQPVINRKKIKPKKVTDILVFILSPNLVNNLFISHRIKKCHVFLSSLIKNKLKTPINIAISAILKTKGFSIPQHDILIKSATAP